MIGTNETTEAGTTRRSVAVSLVVSCAEALALCVAAWVSGSFAVGAQALAGAADVGVQAFLLIGVLSSARPADDTHPLGYGRERFFWSFLAALSSFAGGGVLGLVAAGYAALHPSPVDHYPLAYLVLVTTLALDAFALEVTLRSLRNEAAKHGYSTANPPGTYHRLCFEGARGGWRHGRHRRRRCPGRVVPQPADRKPDARYGGERAHRRAAARWLGARCYARTGSFSPVAVFHFRWFARCTHWSPHSRTWLRSPTCSPWLWGHRA